MSTINELLIQREELLSKIRSIEESCEGIENESNARKIASLNMQQSRVAAQKSELQTKLAALEREINAISEEIRALSGTGVERILQSIKEQRWFFFKNKPKVLMDKLTGILWANLDYFPYINANSSSSYSPDEVKTLIKGLNINDYGNWVLPKLNDFKFMIADKGFPFQEGNHYRIKGQWAWYCDMSGYSGNGTDLDTLGSQQNFSDGYVLPCYYSLTDKNYAQNVDQNNKVYTELERLQFTLNLFVNNGLEPIFANEEITQLYKKIYVEKPILLLRLNEIQAEINSIQQVVLLSSAFDYQIMLANYDIKVIEDSVIKYYQAVIKIADEFMDKLRYYENVKSETIRDFNVISLKLSRKYDDTPHLNAEENKLLASRQVFFKKHFELGMNVVNSQILAIKNQAEAIENRIDAINSGNNAISELAVLEAEQRASFIFIVENIATIIKNALCKIEFFEKNKSFAKNAVILWEQWSENYKAFKTKLKEELKAVCDSDSIDEDVYSNWYVDWQKKRFIVETKFLPLIASGLKNRLLEANEGQETIVEQVVALLQSYKEGIDKFYLEERKNIHQKFAFVPGGEVQEKFETESELYKLTTALQNHLQQLIFSIDNVEDRLFLLKWAESLIDVQVDEILDFVKDENLLKISETILTEFADLKRQNFEVYLSDSKAYSEALQRREKEYTSLVYKMRKDLMKA